MQKVHFWLTSVAQKHRCLDSLILTQGRGRWTVSPKPKLIRNKRGTGAEMRRAIVCGIVTGAASVSFLCSSNNPRSQFKNDPRSCELNLWKCVKSLKKNNDFNWVWIRDLALPVWFSNQLSYEANDVGSLSIICTSVPMKEMNVIDVI